MLGYFIANNKLSFDFGVYLTDAGRYGIAKKDVSVVSVNGRNGDLMIDNGRYLNKTMSYPCIIIEDFDTNFMNLVNYLVSQVGYFRLQDSFNPTYYMMARYVGDTNPDRIESNGKKGVFTLEFDRMPQKFIVDGENPISITGDRTIFSSYAQEAKPLIRAYGTGTFTINNISVRITTANGYTDIDCDLQEAYKDTLATNCNGNITLVNGNFPMLKPGENSISVSGLSRIEIKPRWWIL